MNTKTAWVGVCALALVLISVNLQVPAGAVTCNYLQLLPCSSAILSSSKPTNKCCVKLREQKPCLCQYKKNPNLKQYVQSSGAKGVLKACKVPAPKC